MKILNKMIRDEIAKTAYLREINKDAPNNVSIKLRDQIKANDKKIEFLKKLSSEVKKTEEKDKNIKGK